MQMLTVKELADLKGCSPQYVKRIALEGKIDFEISLNEKNRKMYLFPLDRLPENLQQKYHKQRQSELVGVDKVVDRAEPKPLDHYSDSERKEIEFWEGLVERWQRYRTQSGERSKVETDQKFELLCRLDYPEMNISIDTLYRKWKSIRNNDLDGLIDKRGKWKKGKSTIHNDLWEAFLYYYLDESQHPIKRCYEYTKMWAQETHPELVAEIPTYTTFYRRTQSDIPDPIKILGREGEKAYDDRCAPYIRRIYDGMASNEYWIADNHTFDIITVDEHGNKHRPYLTAFQDARSGIFVGWFVTYTPSSNATLVALRKGILSYGIPDNIYVDNGREFLTFDIGGLGHRKKKLKSGEERFEPPGVFERLGIHMTNAIVRNAKAKVIERRFLDVKNQLSRAFETYTGGNVVEKPERLKSVIKKGDIITDTEFNEFVELVLEHYFNHQEYNGAVVKDKGKKKVDVFNQYLHRQRKASKEDLSLMLMRTSRPTKIGRCGVSIKINGAQVDFADDELRNSTMFGKQVYARYDPDDLSEVRIYDMEDRFIRTVPAVSKAILKYGASSEDIKEAMQITRSPKRHAKELLDGLVSAGFDQRSVIDLLITNAKENKEAYASVRANPKVIDIVRVNEIPLLQKVSGGIDLDLMNQNAMNERGENRNG